MVFPRPARLCALFQQLRMRLQVPHCATDTLLNRDLRPPAKCLELGGVKVHEWRVAEPPALTSSRKVSNSLQAELLDDDVCQSQHIHKPVVAKVEDVLEFFSVFNRVEDAVNAIDHIKIRLALLSVSQNFKHLGIAPEFIYKVENHAMRITFSNPRHEAEDVACDAKVFGVGLNHSLARKLASTVEARLKRRVTFRRGKDVRFAINSGTTRKDNVFNLIDPHRLQDVPRGDGVLFKVNLCSLYAAAHVGIRLKVEHKIAICHFLLEAFAVKDVGAHYPDLGIPGMVADELLLAGAEIVIDSHVTGNSSEPIDDMATDKAGAASYKCMLYTSPIHNSTEARVQNQFPIFGLKPRVPLRATALFIRNVNNSRATKVELERNPSQPAHCCKKSALSRWRAIEQ